MIEGIKINPPQRQPRVLAKFVAGIDYLVPFLDIGYVFFWMPGVILFIFGYPLLFSWWSMLVIPITLVIYGLLRRWQDRYVFQRLGVHPEADRRGFIGFLFGYQALTSAASCRWQPDALIRPRCPCRLAAGLGCPPRPGGRAVR
jgi:poly-beta-1,6-N-acetyl-D-glucosamine synthase